MSDEQPLIRHKAPAPVMVTRRGNTAPRIVNVTSGDYRVVSSVLLPQIQAIQAEVEADRAEVATNTAAADDDADRAVTARIAAETAANAAGLAALEIAATVPLYPDTATGLAAVAEGEYFRVAGDNTNTYTLLYREVGGAAIFVASVPSKTYFDALIASLDRLAFIEPVDGVIPYHVHGDGKVALGLDVSVPGAEKLVGAFAYTEAMLDAMAAKIQQIVDNTLFSIMQIEPADGIIPFWVMGGKVVIGFDTATETLVGAFDTNSATAAAGSNASHCETATWNGLVGYGQSLSLGTHSLPLLSTAQPYSNLTFGAGPKSTGASGFNPGLTSTKALVEDEQANYSGSANPGETPCSGAANTLSERAARDGGLDPASFIVLASTAGHGGYRIDELYKSSTWYSLLIQHVQAGYDLAPANGYVCCAVFWIQGEADAIAGTTAASYKANLIQLQSDIQSDIRNITGQSSPVYLIVMQTTHLATSTGAAIQQAQYEAALETEGIIIAAPMYHLDRYADSIHLENTGSRMAGVHIGAVASKLIADGVIPDKWECVSAVARGAELRLKFNAPVLPIVIDTTGLAATTQNGFAVSDGTGTLTLSGFTVENDDELVITLNRSLGASPVLRYARDAMAAGGPSISGGASGNLRDSNAATVILDGTELPLWTPCPAFNLNIIKLS